MPEAYQCANCGKEIEEGQFIAIIGKAPASGLSMPIGRADKLLDDIGRSYDLECFQSIAPRRMIAIALGESDRADE